MRDFHIVNCNEYIQKGFQKNQLKTENRSATRFIALNIRCEHF